MTIEIITMKYRNVLICDNLASWSQLDSFNESDLVLTFDFALYRQLKNRGNPVEFVDALESKDYLHQENYNIYDFFHNWHKDNDGNDLFKYKNIDFGIATRLEYWNDFSYSLRLLLNLKCLNKISYKKLFVCSKNEVLIKTLDWLRIEYFAIGNPLSFDNSNYYFPISKWMDSKVRPTGFKKLLYSIRAGLNKLHETCFYHIDQFSTKIYQRKNKIFVQEYNPTRAIINHYVDEVSTVPYLLNVTDLSNVSRLRKIRLFPCSSMNDDRSSEVQKIIFQYNNRKCKKLVLIDGSDVSDFAYDIIEQRVFSVLTDYLNTLDWIISKLDKDPMDLNVIIANLGRDVTLLDCVSRSKNIPSFLIINGLLGTDYLDESKVATYINSYSDSIKKHYFSNKRNVYCLGDPRMDVYLGKSKTVSRVNSTLAIGASGFNSVDLNSYVAVEFDFMFDVLSAARKSGVFEKVVIKSRANGYKEQYQRFTREYFSDLNIEVIDTSPMIDVLMKADFYVSIYSQTIFEASILGIPSLYYKKDREVKHPPFDGKSEIVTVWNVMELEEAFNDFASGDSRYDPFLDVACMEKYVGPLDGQNLRRNIEFIDAILAGTID